MTQTDQPADRELHSLVLRLCADVNTTTLEHPHAAEFEQEFMQLIQADRAAQAEALAGKLAAERRDDKGTDIGKGWNLAVDYFSSIIRDGGKERG
jgi:hypothetical protein